MSPAESRQPSDEWVVMGRVGSPHGVRGACRIQTYSTLPGTLGAYPQWGLAENGTYRLFTVESWQSQGPGLVAHLRGIEDRNMAFELRGRNIAIPRSQLPPVAADEFYWADLVGLTVVNPQGEHLGQVESLLETGAHNVLVVQGAGQTPRLIPFVEPVVREVALTSRQIVVNWELDY